MKDFKSGLTLLAAVLLAGCASMARLDMTVQLDSKEIESTGTVPTIEVNLVGVNEAELPQWRDYSMDSFWSADDNLRGGADKFVMKFSETTALKQVLSRDDPIWDVWKKKTAKKLFVIADIPGYAGAKGSADGRLMVLPLEPKAWSGKEVTVTVKRGGLTCLPSPKMKE